ncbi:23S rRNA (guanosine(2251)-2'-O)-methyltransferase RlmB [Aquibaculum sediminis]|uniref:23S rRNA (guanosine(2251)-2'-O)-methyltransferase RlmB n=1 Tax=Aquibaculum sediminis TaxID=3231907 RepID=UPI0034534C6E
MPRRKPSRTDAVQRGSTRRESPSPREERGAQRDAQPQATGAPPRRNRPSRPSPAGARGLLLYGAHAVRAALGNPQRRCHRLLLTEEAERREGRSLEPLLRAHPGGVPVERMTREALEDLLPGAVHQGMALDAAPLDPPLLQDFLAELPPGPALLLLLDQVTDPHNVGAILRSAAVFGAAAVVAPERHAATESGTLAKAASGALEEVPYLREVNLARSLDQLKAAGFWVLGFAGEAPQSLGSYDPPERIALCLGAEGAGLRRLTRERCDLLLSLPAEGSFRDLNVSNAAAVALFALSHKRLEGAQ